MNSQVEVYDILVMAGDILRCSNYIGRIVGGRVDKGTMQFVTYMASFTAQHSRHIMYIHRLLS
jgi:predicted membrane GTPase involved in stress response